MAGFLSQLFLTSYLAAAEETTMLLLGHLFRQCRIYTFIMVSMEFCLMRSLLLKNFQSACSFCQSSKIQIIVGNVIFLVNKYSEFYSFSDEKENPSIFSMIRQVQLKWMEGSGRSCYPNFQGQQVRKIKKINSSMDKPCSKEVLCLFKK